MSPSISINKKRKEKILQQNGKFYGNILAEEEGPLAVVDTDGASEAGVYLLVEVLIRCIEANIVSYRLERKSRLFFIDLFFYNNSK